ncbi:MAG: hypothetical protein INQ03_09550 [Candidatus Heimdallarchaeota archaeon]|nr:hypothetical protein [Candidatus Heimdallarchaeota archaeon]
MIAEKLLFSTDLSLSNPEAIEVTQEYMEKIIAFVNSSKDFDVNDNSTGIIVLYLDDLWVVKIIKDDSKLSFFRIHPDYNPLLSIENNPFVNITYDAKRVEIRNYSHDLSNLLTVMLINLGFLHDQVTEGEIKSTDNETIIDVLSSSLESTNRLKNLIEETRKTNEWDESEIEGETEVEIALYNALSYVNKHIEKPYTLQASITNGSTFSLNLDSMSRFLSIFLINSMYAIINPTIQLFVDDNKISYRDNGPDYLLEGNKVYREYPANVVEFIREYPNIIKKLVHTVQGEIEFNNSGIEIKKS